MPVPDIQIASRRSKHSRLLERLFIRLTLVAAVGMGLLVIAIALTVLRRAFPAISEFGFAFLWQSEWNSVPGRETYGALPRIYGTLVTSCIALLIAVPLGVGAAIFLSEDFLPRQIRLVLIFLVELLAAIPSVVYGFWGLIVVVPLLRNFLTWLSSELSWITLFSTASPGPGLLPAGLVLAIMILPIVITLSRDSIAALPPELKQASLALGATRWETILRVLVPAAMSGIAAGTMLALGRAMGETVAVTILIGNANAINLSLLAPGSTISSLLANEFLEAKGLQISALMYAAFVLIVMTLMVNVFAELIVSKLRAKYH